MATTDELIRKFARDAAVFGPSRLGVHVDALEERVRAGAGPTPEQGERLLQTLRGERCFAAMVGVAKLLEAGLTPTSRVYQAQALIDTGSLDDTVEELLERLESDLDKGRLDPLLPGDATERESRRKRLRSETLGLFGRLYKQRFVDAFAKGDRDAAADHLLSAMQYHRRGLAFDAAWHGSNLAALAWRAEHEGFPLGNLPKARAIAAQLEALQRQLGDPDRLGPWDLSALAQARMAQGEWDEGLRFYRDYARKLGAYQGDGAAFMLMGDLRQLREIWLIGEEGEGPRHEILRELSRRILANPDGTVTLSLDEVVQLGSAAPAARSGDRFEAILDDDRNLFPYSVVMNLLPQVRAICQIRGPGGPVGSGFLADAEAVGLEEGGPVLVSASHVLSTKPHLKNTVHPQAAKAFFEAWGDEATPKSIPVNELLWESFPDRCDVSVCRLAELPEGWRAIDVSRRANPFPEPTQDPKQQIGTVVPIGYPGGLTLTFTFGSNPILDHDLHLDPQSPRVIHYKADTLSGSSGGPVLDRAGTVVAVHRKFTETGIAGSRRAFPGAYAANEGIGIHAAARACRGDRDKGRPRGDAI